MTDRVARGARFLLEAQDGDGFWRDYAMPPGASTQWVTAVCGFALDVAGVAARHGLDALRASCRATGWGYNASVATDADSTAWALRWFARAGVVPPVAAIDCLAAYLDGDGGARTFTRDPRYGRWTSPHVDVTAMLGLALVEAGAPGELIERVRTWLLAQRNRDGVWSSFWWTFDAYATARVLELLAATGGIPGDVRDAAVSWAVEARPASARSAMEAAHSLIAARTLGLAPAPWIAALVEQQCADGGWPASRVLVLPAQGAPAADEPVFADDRRAMSTAMALIALEAPSVRRSGSGGPEGGLYGEAA